MANKIINEDPFDFIRFGDLSPLEKYALLNAVRAIAPLFENALEYDIACNFEELYFIDYHLKLFEPDAIK
jgi:hypothetical protein